MTAPIWLALPPEVHSTLLSSGPGPGSLMAAAGAWQSLAAEYADAAAELTTLLGTVQSGAWEGPSAQEYVAAHAPYLAWLTQSSADSAVTAVQHETTAAAYGVALATMPTMIELALNHTMHGVLIGTNFLGINTIPIALNEADYGRMWVQAATSMSTYQAVSMAALAATPPTTPSPPLLAPGVGEAGSSAASARQSTAFAQAADAGNGISTSDFLSDYLNSVYQMFKPIIDFLQDPIGNFMKLIQGLLTNPGPTLVQFGPFLYAVAYQVFSWVGASLTYPQLLLQPLLAIGLGVLGNYYANLQPPAAAPAPAPVPAPQPAPVVRPVLQPNLGVASVSPTVPAPTSAPASPSVPTGAPPSPAPVTPSVLAMAPYAVFGPGPDGESPTFREGSGAKAPASDIAAAAVAAAAAPSLAKRKARRRRTAELPQRQYADAYVDYEPDPEGDQAPRRAPHVSSSSRGAGPFGSTGAATKERTEEATGLTELAGDSYGGGPTDPLLPGGWDPEGGSRN